MNSDNLYIDKDLNLWCTVNSNLYYYVFRQKRTLYFFLKIVRCCKSTVYQSNAYVLLSDSYIYQCRLESAKTFTGSAVVLPLDGNNECT